MLTLLLFIQHLIRYIYSIIGAQHRVIDILLSTSPNSLYCMRQLTNTKQDLLGSMLSVQNVIAFILEPIA